LESQYEILQLIELVDGHQERGRGGIGLKRSDTINFMRFMSITAAKFGMATGLKNAMDTIRDLNPYIAFAVNEECAARNECAVYRGFSKPVFNIEYPPLQQIQTSDAKTRERYCTNDDQLKNYFHTVLKAKKLDGNVEYCNGFSASTPTKDVQEFNGGRLRGSWVMTEPQEGLSIKFRRSLDRMKKLAGRGRHPFEGRSDEYISERTMNSVGKGPKINGRSAWLELEAAELMSSMVN
jgi:hypothetical protein